jgi:hypothetical protein
MPAWVGRQNPATKASKINGQIEVIYVVPFQVEDPDPKEPEKIITKERKHEKSKKLIRFRVFQYSCLKSSHEGSSLSLCL